MTNRKSIVAIIPIRGAADEFEDGPIPLLAGRPLVDYTLMSVKESRLLDRAIVSTDDEDIAAFCRQNGVEAPFIRPPWLSESGASITDVLLHCVDWLTKNEGYEAEWAMKLEVTHPLRPKGMVDSFIQTALSQNVDSAFAVYEEIHSYWTIGPYGKPELVGQGGDLPRKTRRPFYRDLSGLCSITQASNLRAGKLYGKNLGLVPIRDIFAIVDTHEGEGPSYRKKAGFQLAELLAPAFNAAMPAR